MGQINQGFPNLFGTGDKEDSEQDNEGETDETGGDTNSFQAKWGWIENVDNVSEVCRCSWDDVWKMSAIEFLNLICYRNDKIAKDKEELEKWKREH